MIEIPLLTAVFAAEAIVMLLGALFLLLYRGSKKDRTDRAHAEVLIGNIHQAAGVHERDLSAALADDAEWLDPSLRRATLEEVLHKEKALYRQAIQAFLSRDADQLAEIERHVRGLSEPYCRLIRQLLEKAPQAAGDRVAALEAELRQERAEARATGEQLRVALAALEDVSNEYADLFGAHHTTAELSASLAKVLATFHSAAQAVGAGIPSETPCGGDDPERGRP